MYNSRVLRKVIYFLNSVGDSHLVEKFQNYFGVHRIDDFRNGKIVSDCKSWKHQTTPGNSCSDLKIVNYGTVLESCESNLREKNPCVGAEHQNVSPDSPDSELTSDLDSEPESKVMHRISNKFWYYFFTFGASLGYEMFYASFFPFWIWNIDGAVCRRVVMLWVLVMYVGQAMKDIICWPRPSSPPVVHLEPQYVQEYGMPSTHAMVGAAVPFSILIFTQNRYEYPFVAGFVIALAWCTLVCCSRLYMGMHTVLDIIGGLSLVTILMMCIIPFSDVIDHFQLTYPYSPVITISIMILLLIIYPESEHWTPARGDTTIIMGTGGGFVVGSWLNYRLGVIRGSGLPPPYEILWPDYGVIGLALLRAIIGILCIVATRAFFKTITYAIICNFMHLNPNDLKSRQKIVVEVPHKFITYIAIGFVITYVSPFVFRLLNIERITMFTEV